MTQTISIKENTFILHPTGAIYWTERKILLIADVHLGKISHFRKAGMAVPHNAVFGNYRQLDVALSYFEPETLCFLGDLFHSSLNNEFVTFTDWVSRIKVNVLLIAGNHDIINPQKYHDIGIPVHSELIVGDFLLTHHPEDRSGFFNFSGHIHPAVRLRGSGRQWLKLPCFFKKESQMILPAFGDFTGTFLLVPMQNDRIYAVTKDEVIMICD